MRYKRLLSFLLLVAASALAQSVPEPALAGYVTRYGSISDFDVNGKRVNTDSKTSVIVPKGEGIKSETYVSQPLDAVRLYLGEPVEVFGGTDRKTHEVRASELRLRAGGPHPVSGIAVVEGVQEAPGGSRGAAVVVKADGYHIEISSETKKKFTSPLSSEADIAANVVMRYEGVQQADGVVEATQATFWKNTISQKLIDLRAEWDYDPQVSAAERQQSGISKVFRGLDPSAFPLHADAAVQERVTAIGMKLVPAYQKNLPASDATRINFRFYVVDAPKLVAGWPLPSGMILVPVQLVERMQNDSQLAALIADVVAWLLEQQPTQLPLTNGQLAWSLGTMTGSALIPFAGLAYDAYAIPALVSATKQAERNQEQRERVSLSLMHDAGFDLAEAPKKEWLLSRKKAKDLSGSPPKTALYLYGMLGSTWKEAR